MCVKFTRAQAFDMKTKQLTAATIMVCVLGVLLAGCASPSETFYTPMRTVTTPFKGEIQVAASTDLLGDGRALLEQGYFLIGHSDFRGSHTPTIQELKWQAEKVNASYVLYSVSYVQTENGVRNFVLPNPSQTVTTESSGTVYGYGGSAFYSGQSTTVVPGGYSQYSIPYSVAIYDTSEGYFAKRDSTNSDSH
jgi:hypothetical protein